MKKRLGITDDTKPADLAEKGKKAKVAHPIHDYHTGLLVQNKITSGDLIIDLASSNASGTWRHIRSMFGSAPGCT